LGPTVDDWTREAAAAACDAELELDQDLLSEIDAFFTQRGLVMTANNIKQAMIPRGALVLRNPVGTAPCFAIERNGHLLVSLPGVPFEMKYLMQNTVLPMLRERFGLHEVIKSRVLRTCCIGESALADLITDLMTSDNPTVGTAAHAGQTDVRITAKADDPALADRLIAPVEVRLRERIGDWVFGTDQETLPLVLQRLLGERGLSLATCEIPSKGRLSSWLLEAQEDTGSLVGSLVLVPPFQAHMRDGMALDLTLSSSQAECDAAALAVRAWFGADLGLAVTGSQTPAGEEPSMLYMAVATADGVVQGIPRRSRSGGTAAGWLLHYAGDLLRRYLLGLPQV